MSLILLRHTRPEVPEGVCYGRADLPLACGATEQESQDAQEPLQAAKSALASAPLTAYDQNGGIQTHRPRMLAGGLQHTGHGDSQSDVS